MARAKCDPLPQWPPPARHEVGAWEIEQPPILNWAAYLNLPAALPIVWASANAYSIEVALDDHELWIYIPWIILVWCLWYLVGFHVDRLISRQPWRSRREFTAIVSHKSCSRSTSLGT